MNLSVVIPLYNEEESLPELTSWIDRVAVANHLSYEIVMVDDGSRDTSWQVIETLSEKNPAIHAIKFRRNYGKSAALQCGFAATKGDVVITMDADLQDSPDEIPELYRMITEEGYDLVSGWKKKRYDPLNKRLPSKLFNATVRHHTGIRLHDFNCGLKAYRQNVVKSIEVYGDMHRYIPVLAKQAGFLNIGEKVVQHQARKYGKTKFGASRFMHGLLDLLSVLFMTRFSKKPMHLFGSIGVFMFLAGFVAAAWIGVDKLIALERGVRATLVADNPFFYIALICMVLGTILFCTGFLAELVARTGADRNLYHIEKQF